MQRFMSHLVTDNIADGVKNSSSRLTEVSCMRRDKVLQYEKCQLGEI